MLLGTLVSIEQGLHAEGVPRSASGIQEAIKSLKV